MRGLITDQMTNCVKGKRIAGFHHETLDRGVRPLDYTVTFENLDMIPGAFVLEADANTLLLDNGYVVSFGYDNGCIQYFPDASQAEGIKTGRKFITGGYQFRFDLEDGSSLMLMCNSWTGWFKVLPRLEHAPPEKLDPCDGDKYTLEAFRPLLQKHSAVIAVCGTAKGALDIDRGALHDALFRSKVHPKTKASRLTDEEAARLFGAIRGVAQEVLSAGGLSEEVDLWGRKGTYAYAVSAKTVGKPCPVCGMAIAKGNAFGSSIFYCPGCQVEKS